MGMAIGERERPAAIMSAGRGLLPALVDGLGGAVERTALVVLGNEAADLDSCASTLLLALAVPGALPVIKYVSFDAARRPRSDRPSCRRAEFRLRKDVAFAMERVRIAPAALRFVDDVDLAGGFAAGRYQGLALVDHNDPASHQQTLRPYVTMIFDHHRDLGLHPGASPRVVRPTASACTLVAEYLRRRAPGALQDVGVRFLIAATLLLDTHAFSPDLQRQTPDDVALFDEVYPGQLNRDDLFAELLDRRTDLAGFTADDLLLRDLKFAVGDDGARVAVAVVPESIADWRRRDPSWRASVQAWATARQCALVCVIFAFEDDAIRRQILLVDCAAAPGDAFARLHSALLDSELDVAPLDGTPGAIAFEQRNVKCTRKTLLPIVEQCLRSGGPHAP